MDFNVHVKSLVGLKSLIWRVKWKRVTTSLELDAWVKQRINGIYDGCHHRLHSHLTLISDEYFESADNRLILKLDLPLTPYFNILVFVDDRFWTLNHWVDMMSSQFAPWDIFRRILMRWGLYQTWLRDVLLESNLTPPLLTQSLLEKTSAVHAHSTVYTHSTVYAPPARVCCV